MTYEDSIKFYNSHSNSALRAGSRKYTCPDCGQKNALTAEDVRLGYHCDRCADGLEASGRFGIG
jgi:predicted RNA-binding Zn-ribbon protein involved in translation (DUF1610 family)